MSAPRPKPADSPKRDVKIATAISFFVTAGISLMFLMNASVSQGLSAGGILLVAAVVFLLALGTMRLVARLRGVR